MGGAELPPNGQGIAALEALQILAQDDLTAPGHNTPDSIHLQQEAMKLAFHDARKHITDPEFANIPVEELISVDYAEKQRARISSGQAIEHPTPGALNGGDTVYICIADSEGNVVSWINSIFMPWGCGWTVGEPGILLQNRGFSFSLDPGDVNVIAPHKRTRHTIIPAMMLYEGKPLMAFGCVGGEMQAQRQVQFICNVVDFGVNLQDALDAPRWRYEGVGAKLALKTGIPHDTWQELNKRKHEIVGRGGFFGGGQAVLIHPEYGTYQGGSDPRRDG